MESALIERLQSLKIPAAERAAQFMTRHWRLICEWNPRMNLTSIKSDLDAVALHYEDSVHAAQHMLPGTILDIGSGAGFPGIPLAIALPAQTITLMEPRRKRVSFLRTCVSRLGLTNVRLLHGRSDQLTPAPFDNVVTRATFSESEQFDSALQWIAQAGQLLAFRAFDAPRLPESTAFPYTVGGQTRRYDLVGLNHR